MCSLTDPNCSSASNKKKPADRFLNPLGFFPLNVVVFPHTKTHVMESSLAAGLSTKKRFFKCGGIKLNRCSDEEILWTRDRVHAFWVCGLVHVPGRKKDFIEIGIAQEHSPGHRSPTSPRGDVRIACIDSTDTEKKQMRKQPTA